MTTPGLGETLRVGHALVRVETSVVNESGADWTVTVVSTVLDPRGRAVARNSPAVIMWSIGSGILDSTSTAGLAMADRLIDGVRRLDTTRPIVLCSQP